MCEQADTGEPGTWEGLWASTRTREAIKDHCSLFVCLSMENKSQEPLLLPGQRADSSLLRCLGAV